MYGCDDWKITHGEYTPPADLIGKVLRIKNFQIKDEDEGDWFIFEDSDGVIYKMAHMQDCCETVRFVELQIDDVTFDRYSMCSDLIGQPIKVDFIEEINDITECITGDTSTRTTFKFTTTGGPTVIFIWEGWSNGYYSETPDIRRLPNETNNTPNT